MVKIFFDALLNLYIDSSPWLVLTVIYLICYIEPLIHEHIHFFFQKKFGIGVKLLRFGWPIMIRFKSRKTDLAFGPIPIIHESRSVGEYGEDNNNPESLYYHQRPPYQRLITALSAPLITFGLTLLTLKIYLSLSAEKYSSLIVVALGFVIVNELFNLVIPFKIGRQKSDAWIVCESFYQMYQNRKPRS